MMLNPINSSSKTISFSCVITAIYLPLYLLLLVHTDNLYKIGSFNCLPLLLAICGAEILKFCLYFFFIDNSFGSRDKSSKMKKVYLKLKVKEIFKSMYLLIGSTAVFYVLAVLFGAPLMSECEETLMFSLLMTSLAIFPSCLHLGADNTVSLIIGVKHLQNAVADLLLKNMTLTLLGAWVGAVVIPLDWDRPWQKWPITCCIGAISGFLVSHLFVLIKSIPVPFLRKVK